MPLRVRTNATVRSGFPRSALARRRNEGPDRRPPSHRGLPDWLTRKGAGHGGRWWWEAGLGAMHTALPGSYFERLGVPRLAAQTSTH